MMLGSWKIHLCLVGGLGLLYYLYTPWLLFPIFLVIFIFLGGALAILRGGYELRRPETQPRPPNPKTDSVLFRMKVYPPRTIRPTLVSANVDACIIRVIDLILMHHVTPLYTIVASNHENFFASLVPEIWSVLHVLLKRVSQIDTLKLISHDTIEVLRKHFLCFRGLRNTQTTPLPRQFPDLKNFPYLENSETELEFLRKAVEALLCVCLQRQYLECTPVRILIREYLVCRIFQPTIDKICEPDYINQKLIAYLLKQEEVTKASQKRYAHSETYEDFMQHIKKCEDINELTLIRQSIITDIMQAKAVQRMKEASSTGIRVASLPVSVSADKAKMLMERDLKLYITQLTTAKGVCERCIRNLGGEDYQQDKIEGERAKPDFPRPIPFETIMMNEKAMDYFLKFLDYSGFGNLLWFWKEAQNIDKDNSDDVSHQIKSIYNQYLAKNAEYAIYPDFELLTELEKSLDTEQFLSGNVSASIELLHTIQRSVYCELQEHHYESFLYSESFKDFMEGEAESEDVASLLSYKERGGHRSASPSISLSSEENMYQVKLKSLKKQLSEKDNLLASLKTPASTDSTARVRRLEKGRTELQEEIKQLQRYVEHTEEWFGTVGKWNVAISSVDLSEQEGNDKDPLLIVVIHRPEVGMVHNISDMSLEEQPSKDSPLHPKISTGSIASSLTPASSEQSYSLEEGSTDEDGVMSLSSDSENNIPKSAGWVVGRHLSEFQDLHQKISLVVPNLVFPPLPRKFIFPFQRKGEKKYWDNYRLALQVYINRVIQDPRLVESEEVFNFLSPASADLSYKEGKAIKQLQLKENKAEEPILDSVSSLISEVFDLQDRSRVLRRQLYELAQLTFGRNIEGELQDFMKWVVSEPMLVYYVETFRESMWPNGEPGKPPPVRSDEEKELTKEAAKDRFLKCAPQTLQTVLGQRNCQIGFLKMFTAFQDRLANKQLFYSFFELLLYALIPELESVELDTGNEQD